MGCFAYFREVGTEEKKREILQSLVKGKQQVFVATNALGLGIDAPHIRAVIHIGVRSRIADYAQESGRAGRDGQKSEAIILRGCWNKRNGERVKDNGWNADKGMQEFIQGIKCRRVVLDREMDGLSLIHI